MARELDQERHYLAAVHQFMADQERIRLSDLERLELRVDALGKSSGGTFSQDYELARQSLELARSRQGRQDESHEKPYFGRIDFRPRLALEPEQLYIGKHAVRDNDSSADLVIDWRAPIAELYYSGTLGRNEYQAPGGYIEGDLTLKRRYTYTKEAAPDIERYFDEGDQIHIATGGADDHALQDEFLRISLEESSTEKLKEIVATIAGEQNRIIRAPKNIPIIVQGAAGAGKTTVALHRLAYLLYLHRAVMKGPEVAIIAPNRLFLEYISEVLPDLGAGEVIQTTLEDLIRRELKLRKYSRSKDDILHVILEGTPREAALAARLARLKGSLIFRDWLTGIAASAQERMCEREPIRVEGVSLYSETEIRRLLLEDLVYLPFNQRRESLETYVRRNLKERTKRAVQQIEERFNQKIIGIKRLYSDDEPLMRQRIRETYQSRDEILDELPKLARLAVKDYFKGFREITIAELYEASLRDVTLLSSLDIDEELVTSLTEYSGADPGADDLSAMMYLSLLIDGTAHSFAHIVVDEAQDYSPLQLEVIRRLARQDSVTLVGDLAQGIYAWRAIASWDEASAVFPGGTMYYPLKNSYRSTMEIIHQANDVLAQMDLDLDQAVPVLRHGPVPQRLVWHDEMELAEILRQVLDQMETDGRKSLALVTRTHGEAKAAWNRLKKIIPELEFIDEHRDKSRLGRVLLPSYMTKGLEFDCVVLLDESAFDSSELDLRLKYVSLTRALHLEYILDRAPRPDGVPPESPTQ